jgi:hypothetical protein
MNLAVLSSVSPPARRSSGDETIGRMRRLSAPLTAIGCVVWLLGVAATTLRAHSGPPFPIVTARTVGPYRLSVWADPDATDDGSAAGQFWVMLEAAQASAPLPADTRADVSIRARDRAGDARSRRAEPVNGSVGRQFAALVMDHEGPYAVQVSIQGGAGPASVQADVDATYDLRPPRFMLAVYLVPFLLVGWLWTKLLIRRRHRAITSRPAS